MWWDRKPNLLEVTKLHLDLIIILISVLPKVNFTLEGRNYISNPHFVMKGEVVIATCNALDGRPPANITWLIDNQVTDALECNISNTVSTHADEETFDVTSTLLLKIKNEDTGSISCLIHFGNNFPHRELVALYSVVGKRYYLP